MTERRPTRYTAAVATHILEELRGGRTLFDICQDDDLPSNVTVMDWVRQDRAGFAARYHMAREIGTPAASGRPTRYTAEIAERILAELSAGRTLSDVCGDPGMPSDRTVLNWVARDRHGFKARYQTAREAGCYAMADQIIDIADGRRNPVMPPGEDGGMVAVPDPDDIHRSRLRCDMRRWLVARLLPKRFGSKPVLDPDPPPRDTLAELLKEIDGQSRGLPKDRINRPNE
jgi:hypothetical protein